MKALLLSVSLVSAVAFAQEASPPPQGCALWKNPGLPEGPLALGYFEADVATGRRVCPRTEVGVGTRLGLTIDTPGLYGAISADGLLFGSLALNERTELFATLEAVHHQWVQNASIKGSNTSLGQLTAGASRITLLSGNLISATSVRLMLPTSMATPHVRVLGVEAGQAASYRRFDGLEVHGYLGADLAAGLSGASADPRLGVLLNAGAQWSFHSRFALLLDLNGHLGGTATYFAPSLGLRVRPVGNLGAELAFTLPLAGDDRHSGLVGFRLGYRL